MDAVSFPLVRYRGLGIAGACLSIAYGGLIIATFSQFPATSLFHVLYMLFWLALGILLVIVGAVGLVRCLTDVHMTPGGVELTLCGKIYRRYPLESLKTFCLIQRGVAKSQTTHLCISTRTVEQLAEQWEAKYPGDERARSRAALRRRTTWQEAYAGEYLRRLARTIPVMLPGKELLWLGFSLESLALLHHAYPDVPWLIAPEAQSSPMRYCEDSEPTTAVFPDTKKTLAFDASGICLVQGSRRKTLLHAADVRSIICLDRLMAGAGYYQKYLILSAESASDMIAAQEKCAAQLPPDLRSRLALRDACARKMPALVYWRKNTVAVPWFASREEALRALYPDAACFDCTNESLFRAIFGTGAQQ